MKRLNRFFIMLFIMYTLCCIVTPARGVESLERLFEKASQTGLTEKQESEIAAELLKTFLATPEDFVQSLSKHLDNRNAVLGVFMRALTENHPDIEAYQTVVSQMLTKSLTAEEKPIIYRMAWDSGLSCYLSEPPVAADFALLFDMKLYSDGVYSTLCNTYLIDFSLADTHGFIEAMALTDPGNWERYASGMAFDSLPEQLNLLIQNIEQCTENITDDQQLGCVEILKKECEKYIKPEPAETSPVNSTETNPIETTTSITMEPTETQPLQPLPRDEKPQWGWIWAVVLAVVVIGCTIVQHARKQ